VPKFIDINNCSSKEPSKWPTICLPYVITTNPFCFLSNLCCLIFTYQHPLRLHLLLQFSKPVIYSFEGFGISDVEYQQSYLRVSVIKGHDGSKTLISCRVPDVELNLLTSFCFYLFLLIGSCECRLMYFFEDSLFVAHCDGSFTDSCISTQYKFDCFFCRVGFLQNFIFAGFCGRLLFFCTVTHLMI